jgi:hypothetical protein
MNACPDLLAALKLRMRDLELDAVEVKARISELGEMITMLEHPQRKRSRPQGPRAVFTPRRVTPSDPPLHVPGAVHTPLTVTTQPDDDELPFQSDAPGA